MEKEKSEFSAGKGNDLLGQTVVCCEVCCLSFNESVAHTPRLLHCGHTLCHTCLQMLIKDSVIVCPFDRKLTPVMNNTVSSMPKNYALIAIYSEDEVGGIENDTKLSTITLVEPDDEGTDLSLEIYQSHNERELFCSSCKPSTEHQSRAIHALGLLVLMGNLFFDWLVQNHVNKIVDSLVVSSSVDIQSLKKVHDLGFDWNVIRFVFLEFALFTTVCFAVQFLGTMLIWCFTNGKKVGFQKILLWASLLLNDLPQCILTVIITYTVDDAYIPYLCSTMFGAVGNYVIAYALSNTETLNYPKLIWCHTSLTAICLIIQIALITKAHVT